MSPTGEMWRLDAPTGEMLAVLVTKWIVVSLSVSCHTLLTVVSLQLTRVNR